AIALLRRDGDELVPRARDEIGELHLCNWPHPHDRRAGAGTDDRRLRERCVHHAPVSELLLKAERHLEGAAVHADVLADHEHALVTPHLRAEAVADRLEIGEFSTLLL